MWLITHSYNSYNIGMPVMASTSTDITELSPFRFALKNPTHNIIYAYKLTDEEVADYVEGTSK